MKWKITITITLYCIMIFLANRFAENLATENTIKAIITTLKSLDSNLFHLRLNLKATVIGSMIYGIVIIYYYTERRRVYRTGKEYGSARWANKEEINKLMNKDFSKNILFTETEKMDMETWNTRKNNNVLVIGGSGSGKTRFYCMPNILQAHSSFVVTDPKGEIHRKTGQFLKRNGYDVRVLNVVDMKESSTYNPFAYIREERDVTKMVNCIMKNSSKESKGSDPFWEKSEIVLLEALCYYVWYELPQQEQNFESVMSLLRLGEAKEDEEDYESELDILFKTLETEKADNIAVKQYRIFKQASGKTAKSILISVGVRLGIFNITAVKGLTKKDTLYLDEIGDRKTALFIIISDADDTFNFIVSMMYTQLFDTLYNKADNFYNGRLPVHVRCVLDEFANIGQIPNFDKKIATMRSREISANIILQNMAQIKNLYKNSWETITGNCDSLLFLGGQEQSTLDYISKKIGKETIDTRNQTRTRGRTAGASTNYGIIARELITQDELSRMKDANCILFIRGLYPFLSRKYNLQKHKNYKQIEYKTKKIKRGFKDEKNDRKDFYSNNNYVSNN